MPQRADKRSGATGLADAGLWKFLPKPENTLCQTKVIYAAGRTCCMFFSFSTLLFVSVLFQVPRLESEPDRQMLVVGGILNIIVPTGMGAVICGLATNKRQFVVIGSFQLLTSFLIVGAVWSMLTGIQMIAQGSGLFKVPRNRTTQTRKASSVQDRDLEAGPVGNPPDGPAEQPASAPSVVPKDIPLCELPTQDLPSVPSTGPREAAKAQPGSPGHATPDRGQTSLLQVNVVGGSSEHATTALGEDLEPQPDDKKQQTPDEGTAQPQGTEQAPLAADEKPIESRSLEEQRATPAVEVEDTQGVSSYDEKASAPGALIDLAVPSPPPPPTTEGTGAGVEDSSQPAAPSPPGQASPTKNLQDSPRQGESLAVCPELPVELL